jgi:hypothetical protein
MLTDADANALEHAFAAKLSGLDRTAIGPSRAEGGRQFVAGPSGSNAAASEVEDVQKDIRLRDEGHRKFVARQPCLVCGRTLK